MKLKFEHLIAYLPYELKGFCIDDIQCVEVMNGLQKLSDDCVEVFTDNEAVMDLIYFKPILFRKSLLTKEITINGKTFVPKNFLSEKLQMQLDIFNLPEIVDLKVSDYQKLLEWKFDVFGLIDEGLAEPVTEEFNPYK